MKTQDVHDSLTSRSNNKRFWLDSSINFSNPKSPTYRAVPKFKIKTVKNNTLETV